MIGKVVQYNSPRGFGFIKGPNGQRVFVHYTAIENTRCKSLEVGVPVRFAVARGARGFQAVKVTPLR